MAERVVPVEWTTSREVKDVLSATARVFERFGIKVPPVSFPRQSRLVAEYTEDLIRIQALYRDFDAKGLPVKILDSDEPYSAILIHTPQGAQIKLSAEVFEPVFTQSGFNAISADSIITFGTICSLVLKDSASEVEISDYENQTRRLLVDGASSIIKDIAAEHNNPEELVAYIAELENRLQNPTGLVVLAKGQKVLLKEGNCHYLSMFEELEELAIQIIDQYYLRNLFIREMKKTQWFVPPEKWDPYMLSRYKSSMTPKPDDMGNVEQFFADFLSGELAKKRLRIEFGNNNSPKEPELSESPQEDQIGEDNNSLITVKPSEEITTKKSLSAKKSKKRKPKIYPKQKQKIAAEAAKEEVRLRVTKDALSIVDSILLDIANRDDKGKVSLFRNVNHVK